MSDNEITEEKFLSLYLEGANKKLKELKELIKTNKSVDVSKFTEKSIELSSSLSSYLKTYVVDLMNEKGLNLNFPIYQSHNVFVPMVNYLQLRSFSIQLKVLTEFDNFVAKTLEESYPPENLYR
jgi:hypothetical protein